MKVLNFGSLNIDYVYAVPHFVAEGETLSSSSRECFCGGKGLNQSVALSLAGCEVYHAGCIGEEGGMLTDMLKSKGVDVSLVKTVNTPCGHAIIQVNEKGNNCILLFGGANREITEEYINFVLSGFGKGDILVLQNEINMLSRIVELAYDKGMTIVLNPSPFNEKIGEVDLGKVTYLMLNETEGNQLTGKTQPDDVIAAIRAKYPDMKIVLTLGGDGSVFDDGKVRAKQGIFNVPVVDTTAAGDTFTGFFINKISEGATPAEALRIASAASAITVSRKGAAPSIPTTQELNEFLSKH